MRNNFNCDVTCSCSNVQNNEEGGVTVLNMHSSTALFFFSLLFTFGSESAKFGGVSGRSGWEGLRVIKFKMSQR